MKAERIPPEAPTRRVVVVDVDTLARNWWLVLLRGIAGIVFGVFTFFMPEISLTALVLLFGAFSFADGILTLVSAIRRRDPESRGWLVVLRGLAGIAVGVITVVWPGLTALALLYLIAAWALIAGGLEIAAAIRMRHVIENEWLLVLSGIASVALGVLLVLFPGPGALAVVLWIGAFALVYGALLVALSFRLRRWGQSHTQAPRAQPQRA